MAKGKIEGGHEQADIIQRHADNVVDAFSGSDLKTLAAKLETDVDAFEEGREKTCHRSGTPPASSGGRQEMAEAEGLKKRAGLARLRRKGCGAAGPDRVYASCLTSRVNTTSNTGCRSSRTSMES